MSLTRIIAYLLPILLPLVIIVTVNTFSNRPYSDGDARDEAHRDVCTWYCHNHTNYCQANHTNWVSPEMQQTFDPFFYGLIESIESTGFYRLGSVLFLALLWPLLIYLVYLRILRLERRIKALKSKSTG